jgi:cation diffusion facilitator family transporter
MENFKGVRFVLIYTMVLNLVATVAKVAAGYLTGSLSLLADGFDSFFDSFSNVLGLIAIYVARQPPDEEHPYGHRRYEILMTLVVSVLLFVTCYQILKSAYQRLLHPTPPTINVWSFASLLISIAVHVYVTFYEERRGKELKSEFLVADALHTRADIFVSVGVMAGLVVVRFGYPIIDTALAVVIAFMIAKIGFDIIRSSTQILTDAAAIETDRVAEIVRQVPGVESFHRIRSRGQEDDMHLDLHIRVAPQMPLEKAHQVAHEVQREIQTRIPAVRDVIIHVEPQRKTGHSSPEGLLAAVQAVAATMGLSIHHLDAHEIDGRYFLHLHLEVPGQWTLSEAHTQASHLEDEIRAQRPEVAEISTHIEPAPVIRIECDQLLNDAEVAQKVRELAVAVPHVQDCHEVHVQRVGGKLLLVLHCTLAEHLPVEQAHDVATLIEERLRRECSGLGQVTVHVEPAEVTGVTDPPTATEG